MTVRENPAKARTKGALVSPGMVFLHAGQYERGLGDWKTARSVAKCPLYQHDDLSSVPSTTSGSVLIPVTGDGTGVALQFTGPSAQPHQSGFKETQGRGLLGVTLMVDFTCTQ